jgi:hypothetical protein
LTSGGRPGLTREELAEATAHSLLYVARLRHAQLVLSLLALVAFGGLVGALPLVLVIFPHLQGVRVLDAPLPLLLVLTPFPLFVAIGWLYERRADDLEDSFRDLLSEDER